MYILGCHPQRGVKTVCWEARGLQSGSWAPFAIESRGLWHNENVKQWFHFIHCGRSRFPEKPHSSNQSINNWIWFRKWVSRADAAMLRLTSCWPSYTPANYTSSVNCRVIWLRRCGGGCGVTWGGGGFVDPRVAEREGRDDEGQGGMNDTERTLTINCACQGFEQTPNTMY